VTFPIFSDPWMAYLYESASRWLSYHKDGGHVVVATYSKGTYVDNTKEQVMAMFLPT